MSCGRKYPPIPNGIGAIHQVCVDGEGTLWAADDYGDFELAWAAGFFDGEGHVGVSHNGDNKDGSKRVQLNMSIAQVNREPLERFAKAVGSGAVRGPYRQGSGKRPYYQWSCAAHLAAQVIGKLWPFLSGPKRDQAAIAIQAKHDASPFPRVQANYKIPRATISFDLDGTVAQGKWPKRRVIGDPISLGVEMMKHFAEEGYSICVYTSRPQVDEPLIWEWILKHDLPVDKVRCEKPAASLYFDDRALNPWSMEDKR